MIHSQSHVPIICAYCVHVDKLQLPCCRAAFKCRWMVGKAVNITLRGCNT